MHLRKVFLLAGYGVAAAGMTAVTASSAWAWCSPYMQVEATLTVTPPAATPGTVVDIKGQNWAPGTYQVVWDPSRQLITTATVVDGRFATQLVAPEVDPQAYGTPDAHLQIKVEQGGKVGNSFLTLEVTDPRKAPPPPVDSSAPGALQSNSVSRPTVVAPTIPAPVPGPVIGGPVVGGPQTPLVPSPGRGVQGAPSLQPGVRAPSVAGGLTASPSAPPALGLAGLVQPSVAPVDRPASPAVAGDVAGAPSSKTALGDLWDGFNSGLRSRTSGPGLADLPASSTTSPLSNPALLLLPLSLGALAAGFGITEARRRQLVKVTR